MHKQFEKLFSKMGKSGLMKSDSAMQQQMQRNPNEVMRQLSGALDPNLIRNMGGMGNIQQMMKSMASGGGLGDMAQLQKMAAQMGGMGALQGGGGGGRRRKGGGRRR